MNKLEPFLLVFLCLVLLALAILPFVAAFLEVYYGIRI